MISQMNNVKSKHNNKSLNKKNAPTHVNPIPFYTKVNSNSLNSNQRSTSVSKRPAISISSDQTLVLNSSFELGR